MIAITPSPATVNQNNTVTFVATGGTAPYVYSLVSGIGSIGAATGIYTAPPQTGVAVVRVTDALLATVDAAVTINSPLTLFCDLLQQEMGLAAGQVYLWDQKLNIPNDERLYIAVGVISAKPYANNRFLDVSGPGILEVLSTNMQATISIDVISRGPDARDRKEEVILALNSIRSIQYQEANGILIAPHTSSFVNLSEIDGAAIPYRFNLSLNLQYKISKTKAVPYYDQFQVPPQTILIDP